MNITIGELLALYNDESQAVNVMGLQDTLQLKTFSISSHIF